MVPLWSVSVVGIWEILKWAVRRVCARRKTAESYAQTQALPAVNHPLPDSVKPLPRILFALCRADESIPTELYSEEVQHEFFGLVGTYLRRISEGEDSSD